MVKTLFSEWRKNNPDPATTENGKEASMYNPRFEKEEFKKEVTNNVKTLFRRTVEEASPQQLFQAVSYAVKEAIIDDWIATQKQMDKDDPKMVYYMSMEFLLGRALGNNLINMTAYKEVKEALDEMGIDLNAIEDQEPDPPLETAVWDVWRPVSWTLWQPWATLPMAVVSVTATACSSRRSRTAIRWRPRTTGSKTAIPLS